MPAEQRVERRTFVEQALGGGGIAGRGRHRALTVELGAHAARRDHHERAELRVPEGADQDLEALDHRLHQARLAARP